MALGACLFMACASGPLDITEGTSPAELIQRGQEASDQDRYGLAIQYYQAVIERFPNDIDNICAAEYEIAFIHYKQKKYESAKAELNALRDRYNDLDAETFPQQFKILAGIVLTKIAEQEAVQ
jgi:outer membrane protein assembly factor BamD (BamD/ComL family)